jgi:hypothetical protein
MKRKPRKNKLRALAFSIVMIASLMHADQILKYNNMD